MGLARSARPILRGPAGGVRRGGAHRGISMYIGYVGLGSMGGAIARRMLLTRSLRVHDLVPERAAALGAAGAVPAQDLTSLAAASDVVCLCLPTSAEVRGA